VKALMFRHNLVCGSGTLALATCGTPVISGAERPRRFEWIPVITCRFPPERWDEAVPTANDARRSGAVKVLLEPPR
jgi:hypothetical protein